MVNLVGLLFFISGACSLIYEVVWARYLALYLGNTTLAHTVVIGTFMGGLGIGYALFSAWSDRLLKPLRTWAYVELAISCWALIFVNLLAGVAGVLEPVMRSIGPSSPLGTAVGLVIAVVTLLPPTILMGATLPILVGWSARSIGNVGKSIAWLYALNSAGAVLGVLAGGLYLVEHLGLSSTLQFSAVLNLGVAAVLWWISRDETSEIQGNDSEAHGKGETFYSHTEQRWAYVSAAVLGFVSLALQGVWIRFFAVTLGSSTYSLSIVIAAFIAGIALGSALVRRLLRKGLPFDALTKVVLIAALALWLTGLTYERIPYDMLRLKLFLKASNAGFSVFLILKLFFVFSLLLVPTSMFGMALPLAARVAARRAPGAGTGRIFATNTAAAVVGIALSVPILVPWLGLGGVYRGASALLAVLALGLIGLRKSRYVMCALALIVLNVTWAAGWTPEVLSAGAFRIRTAPSGDFSEYKRKLMESRLLFYEDGPNASVAVLKKGKHRVLKVNGKADASTRGDMLTQIASAHVPISLHKRPSRVLIVGLGSGVTAGSALTHGLDVDVVELSAAVVRAASFFRDANKGALSHPRISVIQDDIRSFLQSTEQRYDVLISEPSNPWMAGNAGLFTVEFFALAKERLNSGGIMAQWFHLYEMDDATVRMVLRTFAAVFEHVTLWELFPNDLLLIGSDDNSLGQIPLDLTSRLNEPNVSRDLSRLGLPGIPGLLSLQVLGKQGVVEMLETSGPINRDDFPVLEFEAPRRLYLGQRAAALRKLDGRHSNSNSDDRLLSAWLQQHELNLADAEALFAFHTRYPAAPVSFRMALVERFLADSGPAFLTDLLFTLDRERQWKMATRVAERLRVRAPNYPRGIYAVARTALALRQHHHPMPGMISNEQIDRLLRHCIALGDDPLQRCSALAQKLTTSQ